MNQPPASLLNALQKAALLESEGKLAEALLVCKSAVQQSPDRPESWQSLALILRRLGRLDEALAAFGRAAREPGQVDALCGMGDVLLLQGRIPGAIQVYRALLAIAPNYLSAWVNLGAALYRQGSFAESEQVCRHALTLDPGSVNALSNLGNALVEQDRVPEGIEVLNRALALRPDHPETLCNLGNAHLRLNLTRDAIQHFKEAQKQAPDLAEPVLLEGIAWLRLGRYDEGWPRYEHRLKTRSHLARHSFSKPGLAPKTELRGKTVLLHTNPGLGDDLQFLRFAPMLRERGARVIAELPTPLLALARQSFPGIEFAPEEDGKARLQPHDFQCLLMSLPHVLGLNSPEGLSPKSGYLRADEARVAHWRGALDRDRGPRVGIAWAGHPDNVNDHRRSLSAAWMRSLFSGFKGTVVSLQKDLREADKPALGEWTSLRQVLPDSADFAETAALIQSLDLVITVDTAVAHLAGGLGKPVWLLLPFSPDWRWLLDREDSPWYPSMRLFRQTAPGDWNSVAGSLGKALGSL